MNITNMFIRLSSFLTEVKKKEDDQYEEFLKFYETIVRTVSPTVVREFGRMKVDVIDDKTKKTWGIELTAADFLFWKNHIQQNNVRFIDNPITVQCNMYSVLSNITDQVNMTVEQRNEFLNLMMSKPSDVESNQDAV